MIINFVINVNNAFLHVLFIIVLKMGIRGAAIAVVLSNLLLLVAVILFIFIRKMHLNTWPGI